MEAPVGLPSMGVNGAWRNGNDAFVVVMVGSARARFLRLVL